MILVIDHLPRKTPLKMASIATVCSRTTPSGRGLFSLASLRAALPATPSETRAFHASSSARAETSTSNSAETTAERIGRPVRLPMGPPKKAKRVFPVPERVLDWAKDGAAEESLKVDGKGNKVF